MCCGTAPGPSVASRRWLGVRRRGQMATQALALSSCLIGTCCQTGPPSPYRRSHSKCRAWRWQRPLQCEAVVALPQPEASPPTFHPHQQVILSILSDSLATPSPRQGGLPLPTSTVKTGAHRVQRVHLYKDFPQALRFDGKMDPGRKRSRSIVSVRMSQGCVVDQ